MTDPMRPIPSLKENVQKDLDILDDYFRSLEKNTRENRQAALSWEIVRESAIAFVDIFDRMKDMTDIQKGE